MAGIITTSMLEERADVYWNYGPSEVVYVPDPICVDPIPQELQNKLGQYVFDMPAAGEFCHAVVTKPAGVSFDKNDDIILDTGHVGRLDVMERNSPYTTAALSALRFYSSHKRAANAVVLSSVWSDNYFHWFAEILPRLYVRELYSVYTGTPTEKVGVFIHPHPTEWQYHSMAMMEIQTSCIEPLTSERYDVGRLIVPTNSRSDGRMRPTAAHWVRSRIMRRLAPLPMSPPDDTLWVSRMRAKERHVVNEASACAALHTEPVPMEDYSLIKQITMARSSGLIVGPHGAGMTNMMWMGPGGGVIEIFGNYINPCYMTLAASLGIKYGFVLGKARKGNVTEVDIDKLMAVKERMT